MSDLTPHHGDTSPFDAIRRTRSDGSEYWTARDLMAPLGYGAEWRNFASVVDKAQVAAANQGYSVADLFVGVTEKGAGRPREDFELARFACYLVAMNGDPRKPEVAAAQAYFAIKTREAETTPPLPMSEDEIVLHALQIQNRKIHQLEAKVAADAPKVEAFDELMESDGTYSMNATAKVLGWGRNVMMHELRRLGVLQGNNLPYQRYEHHFIRARLNRFRDAAGEKFLLDGWGYELAVAMLAVAYADGNDAEADRIAREWGTSGNQHSMARALAAAHAEGRDDEIAQSVSALSPLTGSVDYS